MWQNLKQCGKTYTIIFFGNEILLGNYSLANNLLHYEMKCLCCVGVWRWWFVAKWVILISLMRMDWCGYSLLPVDTVSFVRVNLLEQVAYCNGPMLDRRKKLK